MQNLSQFGVFWLCCSSSLLLKCSHVLMWNVLLWVSEVQMISVRVWVKELWKNGISWSLRWLALAELDVSMVPYNITWRGLFFFFLGIFSPLPCFFALLPDKLSQGSLNITWEPAWNFCVLKLTTDWIFLVYTGLLLQLMSCKWIWEASSL